MADQTRPDQQASQPGPAASEPTPIQATPQATPGTSNTGVSVLIVPMDGNVEVQGRMVIPNVKPNTTIGEIRQQTRAMIPSNPAPERLRFIHAGRRLSDQQTLDQIVNRESLQTNKTISIHLIMQPLPEASRLADPSASRGPTPVHTQPRTALPPGSQGQPFQPASTPTTTNSGNAPNPLYTHAQGQFPQVPTAGLQAQEHFIRQMQQQHFQMMQLVMQQQLQGQQLQGMAPQIATQMPLPDFQRMYNQQAQARQGQQATNQGQNSAQAPSPGPTQAPVQSGTDTTQNSGQGNPQMQRPVRLQPQPGNAPYGGMLFGMQFRGPGMIPGTAMGPSRNMATPFAPPSTVNTYDSIYLLSGPDGHHEAVLLPPPTQLTQLPGMFALTGQANMPQHPGFPPNFAGIHPPMPAAPAFLPAAPAQAQPAVPGQPRPVDHHHQHVHQHQQINARVLFAVLLPFAGHFWLLIRLVGIATLLTYGASWRRIVLVWTGAIIIFLAQTGVLRPLQGLAEQIWVPVRRHVEELVRDVEDEQRLAVVVQGGGNNAVNAGPVGDAGGNAGPRAGELDPRTAAERLLRRQREQSLLRRVERSVALFVASFVPGVGEAQVRRREEAERRRIREAQEREVRENRERNEREERERQERENGEHCVTAEMEPGRISPANQGPSPWAGPAQSTSGSREGLRQRQPRVEDADENEDEA